MLSVGFTTDSCLYICEGNPGRGPEPRELPYVLQLVIDKRFSEPGTDIGCRCVSSQATDGEACTGRPNAM